jgi:hypothetical protein
VGGLFTVSGVVAAGLLYASFPVLQDLVPGLGQVAFLATGIAALLMGRNRYGVGGRLTALPERLRGRRRPVLARATEVVGAAG